MHALRCASGQLAGHSGRGWPAAQLLRRSGCPDVAASAAPRVSRAAWSQREAPGRRRVLLCAASAKTYYEVLGVVQSASGKDIKAAYRKAALKLHPDVNKAPDAKDRFQEAKAAFETLSDANMRAEYDRRLRFGDASSWAGGRSGFGSSGYGGYSSSGGYGQRKPKPEDDYSFDDFLKDLDKEFSGWASERSSKRKGAAPKSLWEELEGIGEEFVDFLEEELGLPKEDEKKASSSSSSSNSKGKSYGDYTSEDWYKKYEAQAGPDSQPPPRPPPSAQPKKSADDDINDMLAALKKKHGRA